MGAERRKSWSPSTNLILVVILNLITTAFAAGVLYMRVLSLERQVSVLVEQIDALHPRR